MITNPHRRHNPLTDEWVLVSANRTNRPWLGSEETLSYHTVPSFDSDCYLCPGNTRASGDINDNYESTYTFTNDFAALRPDTLARRVQQGLLVAEEESGTCRVICYSPRHDLHLGSMARVDVRRVIDLWADQHAELSSTYEWVQIFENRGEAAGASNPHPHGQIWAGSALPVTAEKEARSQRSYYEQHHTLLLLDYINQERDLAERVVLDIGTWIAVVPYWAVWPFEVMILPTTPVRTLQELDGAHRDDLGLLLGNLLRIYDCVFDRPFPFSMGWHNAPSSAVQTRYWQMHAHFYPPLLRSASIRKFMVGYELLAEPQRDITPEYAAARLRSFSASDWCSSDA